MLEQQDFIWVNLLEKTLEYQHPTWPLNLLLAGVMSNFLSTFSPVGSWIVHLLEICLSVTWHIYTSIQKFGVKKSCCFVSRNSYFFGEGRAELIKSDSKDIYNVTKYILCQMNVVLLNFLFTKGKKTVSTAILNSTTFFNIDNNNNQCLLSGKSAY